VKLVVFLPWRGLVVILTVTFCSDRPRSSTSTDVDVVLRVLSVWPLALRRVAATKLNKAEYGDGRYNSKGTADDSLELTSSPVEHNTASKKGGGIYDGHEGSVTLTKSTVKENTAEGAEPEPGGGIYNTEGDPFTFVKSPVKSNTPDNCNSTLTCPV
jgi:hypothetical protein